MTRHHDIFGNDAAFGPMFDEPVAMALKRGGRTVRLAVRASVFSGGTAEPLAEGEMDTEAETFTFVVRERDWPLVENVRRGDEIERGTSRRYLVQSARRDEVMGWTLTAREVRR